MMCGLEGGGFASVQGCCSLLKVRVTLVFFTWSSLLKGT